MDDTKYEPWTELKEAREKAGLSQTALAVKVGMAVQQYSRYENGKADPMNVTLGTALKLSEALGVSLTDLIGDRRKTTKGR